MLSATTASESAWGSYPSMRVTSERSRGSITSTCGIGFEPSCANVKLGSETTDQLVSDASRHCLAESTFAGPPAPSSMTSCSTCTPSPCHALAMCVCIEIVSVLQASHAKLTCAKSSTRMPFDPSVSRKPPSVSVPSSVLPSP